MLVRLCVCVFLCVRVFNRKTASLFEQYKTKGSLERNYI